ncbi:MAG: lytic transglycosylase domain-containing protein [Betaproteobacteria bacterium]|nr:lytic transglycosylase domain-containing protein [Betaproteobacteria bacterium]
MIRTCLWVVLSGACLLAQAVTLPAAVNLDKADLVLREMAHAFAQNDRKKLSQLLPQASGHVLEPWAAYWELRVRLGDASDSEVKTFLERYAGTYQEDRLRNDWLLVLGQRQEWSQFEREFALYRMHDDKEVECYASWLDISQKKFIGTAAQEDFIRKTWLAQRQSEDGCTFGVEQLYLAKRLPSSEIWRKARLMVEFNRKQAAKDALRMVSEQSMKDVDELMVNPNRFLNLRSPYLGKETTEWITLALAKLAASDLEAAAKQLNGKIGQKLQTEQKQWLWGVIGRQAAMQHDNKALDYFAQAGNGAHLTDDMLAWKVRAALRSDSTPPWPLVQATIKAMSPTWQKEAAWVYWLARAEMASQPKGSPLSPHIASALHSIAGPQGFYEQLAEEELGRKISAPARPPVPTALEMAAIKNNPSLLRAMHAIRIGLRADGVREWNYGTGLVDGLGKKGRMGEREKLAAAQWACEQEVWDRCINTSERSMPMDVSQRFPTPFKEQVLGRAKEIGLEAAYVYGLIRQESRFVTDARSSVGAAGLMQVMPTTAKWTAKKLGMKNFQPDQLNQHDTNITIGTGYLKLILDNFQGSMPMAAAAYNAGPSRPRKWRNGPMLEGAIWAECVPFTETRDYVKKVLANTTMYAALLTGEPQSLKARLGKVGPRDSNADLEDTDLP